MKITINLGENIIDLTVLELRTRDRKREREREDERQNHNRELLNLLITTLGGWAAGSLVGPGKVFSNLFRSGPEYLADDEEAFEVHRYAREGFEQRQAEAKANGEDLNTPGVGQLWRHRETGSYWIIESINYGDNPFRADFLLKISQFDPRRVLDQAEGRDTEEPTSIVIPAKTLARKYTMVAGEPYQEDTDENDDVTGTDAE